jgi:CxxC motif-containing protein
MKEHGMEHTKLICITCPKGCTLEVTREGQTIVQVSGGCKRGFHYAEAELTDPRRMIASTVKIHGAIHPLLPVFTQKPFPKPHIMDLLVELHKVSVDAPVHQGQVIVKDILGSGIDIIASRDMEKS